MNEELERVSPQYRAQLLLKERRAHALAVSEERKKEVESLSPEIRRIDEQLAKTAERLLVCLRDGTITVQEIQKENLELQKKKEELLVSLGFPKDYTRPTYTCPLCDDTGLNKKFNHTCSCFMQAVREERLKSSGLGDLLKTQSFETFSLDYYKPKQAPGQDPEQEAKIYSQMESNFNRAIAFSTHFEKGKENLLLVGGTGLGKTHLSTSIAKEVIKLGYDVLYDSIQHIIRAFEYDQFHSGIKNPDDSQSEKYLSVDLLIIDDLGTEFSTPFTTSCLYELLNERLVHGLSTVISTNYSLNELHQKYDERLFSRLLGSYTPLLFVGQDVRLQKMHH